MTPTQSDDDHFMQYLEEHGYAARYATGKPVSRTSTIAYGYYACQNLRATGDPGQVSALPQFALVAEAAQQTLCSHMLGFEAS